MVAGTVGLVQGGVGSQGVEFVPGQGVADREPPRGVSIVAALCQRIGAPGCGGLGGVQPGPSVQCGGVRGIRARGAP
jgi:hypothetical protein